MLYKIEVLEGKCGAIASNNFCYRPMYACRSIRVGLGGADQVVEGCEGCFGSFAHGDDDLLVGHA